MQQLVRDLNRLYRSEPSLHELDVRPEGFSWIDCNDHESSVVSFVRRSSDPADFTLFILNFTPVVRQFYRLGVPEAGRYRELINTDADVYGGSNVGNQGGVDTEDIPDARLRALGQHRAAAAGVPGPETRSRTGEQSRPNRTPRPRSGSIRASLPDPVYARRGNAD